MESPVSEAIFWTIFGIGVTIALAVAGGIVAWVRGLDNETNRTIELRVSDSKRDRENLWDEVHERADQYNREIAQIIDRINVVKDTYVRRDDMAEKFTTLSQKFDEQAKLVETVRNRIHDLASIVISVKTELVTARRDREKEKENGEGQ